MSIGDSVLQVAERWKPLADWLTAIGTLALSSRQYGVLIARAPCACASIRISRLNSMTTRSPSWELRAPCRTVEIAT
jgi:hypothetical protein